MWGLGLEQFTCESHSWNELTCAHPADSAVRSELLTCMAFYFWSFRGRLGKVLEERLYMLLSCVLHQPQQSCVQVAGGGGAGTGRGRA